MESGGNSERESRITRMWDGKSRDTAMRSFRFFSLFLLVHSRTFAFGLDCRVPTMSSGRRWHKEGRVHCDEVRPLKIATWDSSVSLDRKVWYGRVSLV
jgi:hypothetical protein